MLKVVEKPGTREAERVCCWTRSHGRKRGAYWSQRLGPRPTSTSSVTAVRVTKTSMHWWCALIILSYFLRTGLVDLASPRRLAPQFGTRKHLT